MMFELFSIVLGIKVQSLFTMESRMPEWIKTLLIALVTSFFTVCLIEPIRAAIGRWVRRRELRRSLYHEIVLNYRALRGQVVLAEHDPEMRSGIGESFRRSFKKSSFEIAQRDPVAYYGLGFYERYWIELLYSNMDHIIRAKFESDEQALRAASFTADYLLSCVKNRGLNRRLIFRVSPRPLRREFRERLPSISYVDIEPPKLLERLRRKFAD